MNRLLKRALYLIALASLCLIAISVLRLTTHTASATADPLEGISAADKSPVISPDAPVVGQMQDPTGDGFGGAILSAVRQLPSTIAGHAAYVMPSSRGDFCLFVEQLPSACAAPLTADTPALVVTFDPDGSGGAGSTVFGVARDGVESITLSISGTEVQVPVHGNVFELSGTSIAPENFTSVTANFDSGRSVILK